jgi:hypothetical protein
MVAAAACVPLGCCAPQQVGYQPKWFVEPIVALPSYATIASKYNERCKDLNKLRCPANLVIESPGENAGDRRTDQVEANLQFIAPQRIALRVDKVANTLAYLGCNETKYWWLDLGNPKRALVGEHAGATPRSAARFGIPVHPLDLIDLLGVLPLPVEKQPVEWSEDKTLWVVTLPPRGKGWGERTIAIDPATGEPRRIEVYDARGDLAASAELSKFVGVAVRGDTFSKAAMASRYEVEIPATDSTIVVSIAQPENPAERMRTAPFDLPRLLESYGISTVQDVDAASGGAP